MTAPLEDAPAARGGGQTRGDDTGADGAAGEPAGLVAPADEPFADPGPASVPGAEPGAAAEPTAASVLAAPAVSRRGTSRWPGIVRRPRLVAAVAAAGVVAVGALGSLVVDRVTGLPADAVLRVGDTVVTEAEFRRRLDVIHLLRGPDLPPDGAGLPVDGADRDRFGRDAAQATAVGVVVAREAARRGIVVSGAEIDIALARIVERFPQGREGFHGALDRLRLAEPDVRREVRRQVARDKLFAQVVADLPAVTDDEVRQEYAVRRPASEERRRLLNIVVDTRELAEEVLAKARDGAEFGMLAVQYSRDGATRDTGGEFGEPAASQLEKPHADAAFSAPAGALFGPVQTSAGWNVGMVVAVQSSVPRSLEEVADELRSRLAAEREGAAWRAFLAERLRAAGVEYAERYRPVDLEAIPAG